MFKKISIIALAILLTLSMVGVGFAARGDRTSPGKGDILGQGDLPSDAHKIFRLVRYVPAAFNQDIVTLTQDSMVIWDTATPDGVTITTTATSGDARVAGIVVTAILTPDPGTLGNTAAEDIGRRNWGWLQTYGLCEGFAGATFGIETIGDLIATGNHHGTIVTRDAVVYNQVNWTTAGFACETGAASGTDIEVFLRGLD